MLNYSVLGKEIKAARERKSLSQEQLAELLGISVSQLSNIERGNKSTKIETFMKIAFLLDVSMEYLLRYEGNVPKLEQSLHHSISKELDDCTADELIVLEEILGSVTTNG